MELFGGMPDAVKFIIVFLLILGILVPLLWRRFNVGPLKSSGPRGRHARLAVVETAAVDVRHRLVLIKRDNVEHLLLVGGPSDIVVESNITRASTVAREPRPIPDARPEAAAAETPDWSLPVEPMARPVRTVDLDAALPEPPARTAREAMVDSMRSVRSGAAAWRGPPMDVDKPPEEIAARAPTPSPGDANHRPAPEPRHAASEQQRPAPAPPSSDAPPEPKRERAAPPPPRPAPVPAAGPAGNAPRPVQPIPAAIVSAGPAQPPRPAPSDESNLAEMAMRLEAALRRPTKPEPPAAPPVRPPLRQEQPAGRKPAPVDAAAPAKVSVKSPEPPPPDLKVLPGKGKNESAMGSLEDEMAKMLGRPGKS